MTKNKYFGTDGYRGEANVTLTSTNAYKVGRFLGWYFSSSLSGCQKAGYRPKIVIGKDTRRSSYMLEYAIASGIATSGADAYMLHVTTTPSVSYVTRLDGFVYFLFFVSSLTKISICLKVVVITLKQIFTTKTPLLK